MDLIRQKEIKELVKAIDSRIEEAPESEGNELLMKREKLMIEITNLEERIMKAESELGPIADD